MKPIRIVTAIAAILLVVLVFLGRYHGQQPVGDFYSVTERRMPCGRILKREVIHENDAWRKTVTLKDVEGRVLETQTRTVEPEQCARIQAGKFVPGLWRDCAVQI